MSADANPTAAEPEAMTWLWQRQPLSVDLEKVLVPTSWIPAGWLPLLQHRYACGDRVRFFYDTADFDHHGTVVQDQGIYLAIDGDIPGSAYTIHKANICPETGEPAAPAGPDTTTAIDPHNRPAVWHKGYAAIAHWNLGPPHKSGWQPQARLSVTFQPGYGFVATLHSVVERLHTGLRQERQRPVDSVVVHDHPAARPSQKALRACLSAAIDIVQNTTARGEPVVRAHFVPETNPKADNS